MHICGLTAVFIYKVTIHSLETTEDVYVCETYLSASTRVLKHLCNVVCSSLCIRPSTSILCNVVMQVK